jgi:ATP-binding cassette subfamily B protein
MSDEHINRALDIAQATEFVDELEDGLDHVVSQGGTNLSGGQKQRLAIARAIAKDSLVYVFDDSFSALDFKTDSQLRKELRKEINDKIVIIIAQRISSIKDADNIIVLDKGKIVGEGTHESLLDSCTVYQDIVYSQLSEGEL